MTEPQLEAEVDMSGVLEAAKGSQAPRIKTTLFTFEGVKYQVRRDALEDLDVMDWLGQMQDDDDNALLMMLVLKRVLGASQWDKFKDSQRDDSGRADPAKLEAFISGLFEAVGAEKS